MQVSAAGYAARRLGRIDSFQGRLQMAHPDFIAAPDDSYVIPDVEPVYRTTEALSPRTLAQSDRPCAGTPA